jgi:integrase
MPSEHLTQKFIESAKAVPGEERTRYFDTEITGLNLTVTSKGAKSLSVRYRVNGRGNMKTMTLRGLNIKAARKKASGILLAVRDGADPLAERRQEQEASVPLKPDDPASLRGVVNAYFRMEGDKLRTADDRKQALDRLLPEAWWTRRIHDISRREIIAMLDHVQENSGATMAHNLLAYLRKIFNWHQVRDEEFRNPIVRGMGRIKPKKHRRKRVLTDAELQAVWKAADELALRELPQTKEPGAVRIFAWMVMFILTTATRRNEAAKAGWHEVASDRFTVPPQRYKTDQYLIIPLSSAARGLLAQMPRVSKKWVFSTNGKQAIGGYGKPKVEFDKKVQEIMQRDDPDAKMQRWTVHDLRRTARTLLSRAKVPNDISERCIGHAVGEMEDTYDMYEFLDEKREAFEVLGNLIAQIVRGGETKRRLTYRQPRGRSDLRAVA